jgi:hypothetical protein
MQAAETTPHSQPLNGPAIHNVICWTKKLSQGPGRPGMLSSMESATLSKSSQQVRLTKNGHSLCPPRECHVGN